MKFQIFKLTRLSTGKVHTLEETTNLYVICVKKFLQQKGILKDIGKFTLGKENMIATYATNHFLEQIVSEDMYLCSINLGNKRHLKLCVLIIFQCFVGCLIFTLLTFFEELFHEYDQCQKYEFKSGLTFCQV